MYRTLLLFCILLFCNVFRCCLAGFFYSVIVLSSVISDAFFFFAFVNHEISSQKRTEKGHGSFCVVKRLFLFVLILFYWHLNTRRIIVFFVPLQRIISTVNVVTVIHVDVKPVSVNERVVAGFTGSGFFLGVAWVGLGATETWKKKHTKGITCKIADISKTSSTSQVWRRTSPHL